MDVFARFAAETALAQGVFRVVVSYGGGKLTALDFEELSKAQVYADDVAAEWSDEPQLAFVYDATFTRIYEGRAYFSR